MLAALYNIYTLLKDDPAEVHCSTVHRTKLGWSIERLYQLNSSNVIVRTFCIVKLNIQCVFHMTTTNVCFNQRGFNYVPSRTIYNE